MSSTKRWMRAGVRSERKVRSSFGVSSDILEGKNLPRIASIETDLRGFKNFYPLGGGVDHYVSRVSRQCLRRKAVGDATRPYACVASGEHVDIGVADDDGFFGRNSGFSQQSVDSQRIGFLGLKADRKSTRLNS